MHIVLLGDVGSCGGYHLGDEAMAEAVVAELSTRTSVTVTAISGDPEETQHRYGWRAIARMGFSTPGWTDADRDARLSAIVAAARGHIDALPWQDPAWTTIHAVDEADAVVVSGGGNLSSRWPHHVYERAALAQLAAIFNKRHVVTGQTLGPHLTARHGELVAMLLGSAALAATREAASYEVALRLGVLPDRLASVVDDAAYLSPDDPGIDLPGQPYVAATFAPYTGLLGTDDFVARAAELLGHLIDEHSLAVVLVPHHGTVGDGGATGDVAMHQAIAARVDGDVRVLDPISARQAIAVTARASLVVSSRYHPVVFALAAGVPAMALTVDGYTSTKIGGAMENYGVAHFALPVASLALGRAIATVDDVMRDRDRISEHLTQTAEIRRRDASAWWDSVFATLRGDVLADAPRLSLGVSLAFPSDLVTDGALREWSDYVSARREADFLVNEVSAAEIERLELVVVEQERAACLLSADLNRSLEEIATLQESVLAAHRLVSDELQPLATWMEDLPTINGLRAELAAIRNSRAYRLIRRPLAVYRRLRSP